MGVIKTETFHDAWDCDGCGTRGLSAYNCKQCPSCGAPLDDESVYRTRQKVENYNFKGHDVNCAHCGTRNEKRFSCRNCGSSLTDDDDTRVKSFTYKSDIDEKPTRKSRLRGDDSSQRIPTDLSNINPANSDINKKWWYVGGCIALILVSITIWVVSQLYAVIPATLTADRAHWAFYLSLEDFEPRQKTLTVEDGGFGSPPVEAYNVDRRRVFVRFEAIYETRTVSQSCTGTSSQSNGDGTWTETTYSYDCSYSEQVQVGTNSIYGTRFDYTVDRWESISPLTKVGWGQDTDFPTFTTPQHCLSARPTYGCKRAPSKPLLTFTMYFFYYVEENGERQDVERIMKRNIWDSFKIGKKYKAVLNGFGEIRAIEGIDSEYQRLMKN